MDIFWNYTLHFTEVCVDLFHKWRPINNSFVVMKISPTSFVSMGKIHENFYSKMR